VLGAPDDGEPDRGAVRRANVSFSGRLKQAPDVLGLDPSPLLIMFISLSAAAVPRDFGLCRSSYPVRQPAESWRLMSGSLNDVDVEGLSLESLLDW